MQIQVKDLYKAYQDAEKELVVIDRLSFVFPASGSIAIVGRSGIGKSTLLHLLGGLERPSAGRVWYGETELTTLSDDELSSIRGTQVGFIFQFHHLLPEFDALENVAMPLAIQGSSEREARAAAKRMLNRVGLSDRESHRPGQLSGGEQQRVALARALVSRPPIILADEPTGNLDVNTAKQVQDLLLELNREIKNVMIIVTHNLELARQMDTRLEMKPGGELVEVP